MASHGEIGKGRVRDDNVKSIEKGGTSKSYTLKRLARDSESDPAVAEVYSEVKRGDLLRYVPA